MRKVQFIAVFWTLLIAVPMTALAISLAAYATEHFNDVMTAIFNLSEATTVGARGWMQELSARWPEIAGMVVGQLVIMITLLLARRAKMAENGSKA